MLFQFNFSVDILMFQLRTSSFRFNLFFQNHIGWKIQISVSNNLEKQSFLLVVSMFLHDSLQLTKFLTNVHVIGCYIFYLGADKYFQLTTSVCSLFITRVLPVLLSD